MKTNIATFGAGCFWHVQHTFDQLVGVISTEVGYAGGKNTHVTYEEICQGDTGHTEVCRVEFNPEKITYTELLEAFWKMHDPTTENRQGPDVGYQYRSVIFTHTPEQNVEANTSIESHMSQFNNNIVTAVESVSTYCPAEEHHQKYFEKTGKRVCAV